jgi:hypothetical protein
MGPTNGLSSSPALRGSELRDQQMPASEDESSPLRQRDVAVAAPSITGTDRLAGYCQSDLTDSRLKERTF